VKHADLVSLSLVHRPDDLKLLRKNMPDLRRPNSAYS
jgi:hypothetical protein